MSSQEWLANTINRKGGLATLPSSAHIKEIFDLASAERDRVIGVAKEHLFSSGNNRHLSIYYINQMRLGGFASGNQDNDLVGINVGSVFAIYDLFLRTLSHPNTFPEIGTPSLEKSLRAVTKSLSDRVEFSGDYNFVRPNCEVRYWFAIALADCALAFLLFHEIGHLKNGHIDWLIQNSAEQLVNQEKHRLQMQALEMDADTEAIRWLINTRFEEVGSYAIAGQQVLSISAKDVAKILFLRTPKEILRNTFYSAYMIFRLVGPQGWTLADQMQVIHPTIAARLRLISATMCTLVSGNPHYRCSIEDCAQEIASAIKEAEAHFALVQDSEVQTSAVKSTLDEEPIFSDYLHSLHLAWSEIKDQLDSLHRSRGKLAPAYIGWEKYQRASALPSWLPASPPAAAV